MDADSWDGVVASCADRAGTGRHHWKAFRDLGGTGTLGRASDAATHHFDGPCGTGLLLRDLTDAEFAALPVLESLEQLEIEDLTDEEYEKFVAAIS